MGLAGDATLRPHITTIAAELGSTVTRNEIETAVATAANKTLGINLENGALSPWETRHESSSIDDFRIQTDTEAAP
jgi:hypothetical protein